MIKRFYLLLAIISPSLMVSIGYAQQIEFNGFTMGTYYTIKYIDNSNVLAADTAKQAIDAKLELVNDQMSTYRPDSELSRFNLSTAVDTPFPISADLAYVIKNAIEINHLTEGGLDITIGPLVNLWGFGPEHKQSVVPDKDQIEKRRTLVGIDKLTLAQNSLTKSIPGLYLDLSAIAKGYAVDVVSEYLQSQGIDNYLVDIGGEVRANGKNQHDKYWRIAIEKPASDLNRQVYEAVQLNNQSIATSGSYRNYFDENNKHYSHTIDPKTGYPIEHGIVSISVVHHSCMYADGLATGMYVMGFEKSIRLANQLNIPVMIIVTTSDGLQNHYSDAFTAMMTDTN